MVQIQRLLDQDAGDGLEFVCLTIGKKRTYLDPEKNDVYAKRFRATKERNQQLPRTPPHNWLEHLRREADASELLHARGACAQYDQVYQSEILGKKGNPSTVTLLSVAVFKGWNNANTNRFYTDLAYQLWVMQVVHQEKKYFMELCA